MTFYDFVDALANLKNAYKIGDDQAERKGLLLRAEAYHYGYDLYRMEVLANEKVAPGTTTNWEWAFGTICMAAMIAEKEAAE